jgi:hypothetical protein
MIVVPRGNFVGWLDSNLYVMVIREPKDVPGSYPFTVCIRDSSGSVVLSRSFAYDFTRDVETYAVDVSSLSEGVYSVYIYNWTNCNPPPDTLTFRYWLHKITGGAYMSLEDWDFSRLYVFMMYVYDGKLFWKHLVNTSDVVIPSNVPVYLEASDGRGNAFVGSVSGSGTIQVRPNMRIPFVAMFKITYQDRLSQDVVKALSAFVGMIRGAYVDIVDDYTVEIGIVKTEPGVPLLAIAIIMASIVGGFAVFAWWDREVRRIELEKKALDYAKPLIDKMGRAFEKLESMLGMCGPNDWDCIARVQSVWLTVFQMLSSSVGMLLSRGFPLGQCDGVKVGGVCVPWWVVAVAIFLAGLLVIAAVR